MKRLGALGLAALLPFLLGAVGPQATVRIEVRIPERAAMWLEGPDLGPGGSLGRFLWAGRGGEARPSPPTARGTPWTPASACGTRWWSLTSVAPPWGPCPLTARGFTAGTGASWTRTAAPIPPTAWTGKGGSSPGPSASPSSSFTPPCAFTSSPKAPAGPWRWPSRWSPRARKGRCWTRATSPSTPSSRAGAGCPPRPTGSAWPTTRTGTAPFPPLPSPRGAPGGVLLEEVLDHPGGWQSVTLGIKLRLDGSEVPGEYEGQLVYTLTLL